MSVDVGLFEGSPEEWDTFVAGCPDGTFFHRYAWLQVVATAYGGDPYYLAAEERDEVVGVLPVMRRKVLGAGRVLISVPFADEGGICATTVEAEEALVAEAEELGRKLGVGYVELRQLDRCCGEGLPCDTSRVVLRMPLPGTVEELCDGFSSNMRKKIRRARRDGLECEDAGRDAVAAFYEVYARNMRDLGSPMHSVRFFEALYQYFPEETLTVLIRANGDVAAAAIAVWFRDVLTVLCAHALRGYHRLFPNNLLYHRLFEAAIERGCTVADFGRSPRGTGTYDFKKGWGMEDHPLFYTMIPIRSQPHLGERREGLAYTLASRFWQRTPMPIARTVGPWIFSRVGI